MSADSKFLSKTPTEYMNLNDECEFIKRHAFINRQVGQSNWETRACFPNIDSLLQWWHSDNNSSLTEPRLKEASHGRPSSTVFDSRLVRDTKNIRLHFVEVWLKVNERSLAQLQKYYKKSSYDFEMTSSYPAAMTISWFLPDHSHFVTTCLHF